jgi:hypothetical protein
MSKVVKKHSAVGPKEATKLVSEENTIYTTFNIVDATTPVFSCNPSAAYGKQGVRIIERSDYYVITFTSTQYVGAHATVVFDLGEDAVEANKITYTGVVRDGKNPGFRMLDLAGSPDNENWTIIYSAIGGRGAQNIPIPTPNRYRYIRFYTYVDDTRFGSGGVNNFKIYYKKRVPRSNSTVMPECFHETKNQVSYYTQGIPKLSTYVPDLTKEWTQPLFSSANCSTEDNYYTISASQTSGTYYPYKSFNGDKTTGDSTWWTGDIGAITESNAPWIMLRSHYKPLYLTEVDILNETVSPWNYAEGEVQVSDDGNTWKTVSKLTPGTNAAVTTTTSWDLDKPYYYYRLRFTKAFANGITMQDVSFKGFEVTTQQRRPL